MKREIDTAVLELLKAAHTGEQKVEGVAVKTLKDYATGDQWGGGKYWKGREAKSGDNSDIAKKFVQADEIGSALKLHFASLLYHAPKRRMRSLEDSRQETPTEFAAFNDVLQAWAEGVNLHEVHYKVARATAWGKYAFYRIYVPDAYAEYVQGFASSKGQVSNGKSLEFNAQLVHVQPLTREQAGILRDGHGRTLGYYYLYREKEQERIELHTAAWVYQLEASSYRILSQASNIFYDPENLRPRFQMVMLERREPLLTKAIIDKQASLNVDETSMDRNTSLAGFRSIVVSNAEKVRSVYDSHAKAPYRVVDQAQGDGWQDIEDYSEEATWTVGPDMVLELLGVAQPDGAHATPNVHVIDPVRADLYFQPPIEMRCASILSLLYQDWRLSNHKAISAISKQESRAAYNMQIKTDATQIEKADADICAVALEMIMRLSGQRPDAPYRIVADLEVEISSWDIDKFKALLSAKADNLISDALYVENLPFTSDTSGELAFLQQQREDEEQAKEYRVQDAVKAGLFE